MPLVIPQIGITRMFASQGASFVYTHSEHPDTPITGVSGMYAVLFFLFLDHATDT